MTEEWNKVYADRIVAYQNLANAAEYNLWRACCECGLREKDIAEISHRVKERNSLEEKAKRKNYSSPLMATDIVGARVVYLYKSDSEKIEQAVLSILKGSVKNKQIEKVDHSDDSDKTDDLGYRARHYVGYLKQSGLTLVDEVPVEIQVRTIGQHAWALLEQGLVYKTKSAIPQHLLRSVLGLSILYELADERFDQLRKKQFEYEGTLKTARSDDLARTPIDLDSIKIMLERTHHMNLGVGSDPELSWLLQELDNTLFTTIGDVEQTLTKTLPVVRSFLAEKTRQLESPVRERLELVLGLALADPGLIIRGWPQGMNKEDRDRFTTIAKGYSGRSGP